MDLVLTTQKIKEWLEEMAAGLEPGRFRFCSHGSLVPTQGHGGLMATCFAMRSAWQSGVWELWTEERKNASIEFIRSFQRDDGFFEDPWLMKNAGISLETIINFMLGRVPLKKILHLKKMNLRAETRQCLGDLFNVDSQPPNRVPLEQSSIDTLKNYLNSLPWQQPYTTGSHLSHLMCFLANNKPHLGLDLYSSMVDEILEHLKTVQDKKSGTWYQGSPSDTYKINGAMKVLSGLRWIDAGCAFPQQLIDFAMSQPFEKDGCGILNRLFVVQQALISTSPDYRIDEIKDMAATALKHLHKFQKSDGGFSFYINKSQTSYYGVKVSKGSNVSDLHGTAMMTWAIGTAVDLLGESAPSGAESWNVHRA